MRHALTAGLCLYACLLGGQVKTPPAIDKPAMESYLRHLLAIMPEVTIKIDDPKPSNSSDLQEIDVHLSYLGRTQDEVFFLTKDQRLVRGYVYDLKKNPFQPDLDKLKTALSPSFGPANAPVTIVIFSDFQCPICKEEAAVLRENLPANYAKEVRVFFKDLPLVEIHPWAKGAAIAGRCVSRQNPQAFWGYHDWMYAHQSEITAENLKDKVMEFSKAAPDLDGIQLGRCMDTKATEAEVDASMVEAQELKLNATTPTMFVNGRRLIGNYPWVNLDQIIRGELNYQQTAQKADEKCCEVSIPSPLKH